MGVIASLNKHALNILLVIPRFALNLVRKVEIQSKPRNDRRVLPHNLRRAEFI